MRHLTTSFPRTREPICQGLSVERRRSTNFTRPTVCGYRSLRCLGRHYFCFCRSRNSCPCFSIFFIIASALASSSSPSSSSALVSLLLAAGGAAGSGQFKSASLTSRIGAAVPRRLRAHHKIFCADRHRLDANHGRDPVRYRHVAIDLAGHHLRIRIARGHRDRRLVRGQSADSDIGCERRTSGN